MKKRKFTEKKVSWKIFVLVGLVVLLLSLSVFTLTGKIVVANGPRCKDSDGGMKLSIPGTCKNYNAAGSVTATYQDSCASASVKEYYCDKSWFLSSPTCVSSNLKCASCVTGPTGSYCCTPKPCAEDGCGIVSDGCGGILNCGNCGTRYACSGGKCVSNCTHNCSCAADTCYGSVCAASCGEACAGTKIDCGCNECLEDSCTGGGFFNDCYGVNNSTICKKNHYSSCTKLLNSTRATCYNSQCCLPDCSCAVSTCFGSTCSDGCGGTCEGIRTC